MAIYGYLDLFILPVTLHPLKNGGLHRKVLGTSIGGETDYSVPSGFRALGGRLRLPERSLNM